MIDILDVSKKFRLYASPFERVKDWAGLTVHPKEFWALRHFTLSVPRGRTVGIIGPNGAGKSTLLKLITGTLLPTTGTISVHGRVAALLELGTGFHPEFTGRQNIHINGQLLGLSASEIASHEQAIVDFSELGMFIDQPLRTYSSGMIVRLGFAIAASVHPDVLIVDEALSVGDARFSQKCIRRIRQFREDGTTILFVSHDPGAVLALCNEAVLINEGQLLRQGDPSDILDEYNAILAAKGEGNVEMRFHRVGDRESGPGPVRSGTFQALIRRTELLNSRGTPTDLFRPGEPVTIRVVVDFLAPINKPTIGILIKDRLGIEVYGTNSALLGLDTGTWNAGESLTMEFALPLDIGHGDYTLTVAVHDDETHLEACFDWSDRMAAFRVRFADKPTWKGLARLNPTVRNDRALTDPQELQQTLEDIFGAIGPSLHPRASAPSPFLSGFYSCEESGGEHFRWMADRGTFLLRPDGGEIALNLGFHARVSAGMLHSDLVLRVVGHGEIARCSTSEERYTLRAALPAETIGRLTLFELEVSPTFIPADHGGTSGDTRALGAALYAVRAPTWENSPHAPA